MFFVWLVAFVVVVADFFVSKNLNFLRKQRLYRLFSSPSLVIISEVTGQFHSNSREGRGLNDVKISACFVKEIVGEGCTMKLLIIRQQATYRREIHYQCSSDGRLNGTKPTKDTSTGNSTAFIVELIKLIHCKKKKKIQRVF